MEGGPAPNTYRIPTAVGFTGHTPIKRRLPSVAIGQKRNLDPKHGHGLLYDLRQKSRFGKLHHQPNYSFGGRRLAAQDWSPAPNTYHPKMDSVRPNAPQISFKGRTRLGNVQCGHPAPNAYKLPAAAIQLRSAFKTQSRRSHESRFQCKSEGVPAPNTYNLSKLDAYKYKRAANTSIPQMKRMVTTSDHTPAPNLYNLNTRATTSPSITFGQKPSHKRIVYFTIEDLTY